MSEIIKKMNYYEIYDDCKILAKKLGVYAAVIPYSNYTCVTLNVNNESIFNEFKKMLIKNYKDVTEDHFLRSFYVR